MLKYWTVFKSQSRCLCWLVCSINGKLCRKKKEKRSRKKTFAKIPREPLSILLFTNKAKLQSPVSRREWRRVDCRFSSNLGVKVKLKAHTSNSPIISQFVMNASQEKNVKSPWKKNPLQPHYTTSGNLIMLQNILKALSIFHVEKPLKELSAHQLHYWNSIFFTSLSITLPPYIQKKTVQVFFLWLTLIIKKKRRGKKINKSGRRKCRETLYNEQTEKGKFIFHETRTKGKTV